MEQQNEIAQIAYELYLMRNGAPGDPIADWLMAERIYAERNDRFLTMRALQEPVMMEEPIEFVSEETTIEVSKTEKKAAKSEKTTEAPVFLAKDRKKTVKAVETKKTAAPKKEAAKPAIPAAKAAPVKAEAKPVEEVKPKRVVRKKAE